MAIAISQLQPKVSDRVQITALGYIYEVTGLTATDAAPAGKTVLKITMPSGFSYKNAFSFSENSDYSSPVVPDSITGTDIITVTFTSTLLSTTINYYMAFNIQPV